MRFYNIEMKGKFISEIRTSAPSFSANDEGRMYYNCNDNDLYYNNGVSADNKIWTNANISEVKACILDATNTWTCENTFNDGVCFNDDVCHSSESYYSVASGFTMSLPLNNHTANGICMVCPDIGMCIVCSNSFGIKLQNSTLCSCAPVAACFITSGITSNYVAVCAHSQIGGSDSVGVGSYNNQGYAGCFRTCVGCALYAYNDYQGNALRVVSGYDAAVAAAICGCTCGANGLCITTENATFSLFVNNTGTDSRSTAGFYGCCSGCGVLTVQSYGDGSFPAITACGDCNLCVIQACSRNTAIYGYANSCGGSNLNKGVMGEGNNGASGVCGFTDTGYAVDGNVAYGVTSTKYMKYTESICISECLRANPLDVYYYTFEDSNYKGFTAFIGPVAEEFKKTFDIDHNKDTDGPEGLFTVDGVAFGLANENFKEIEKLKLIVQKLYSCILKLEGDK